MNYDFKKDQVIYSPTRLGLCKQLIGRREEKLSYCGNGYYLNAFIFLEEVYFLPLMEYQWSFKRGALFMCVMVSSLLECLLGEEVVGDKRMSRSEL